MSSPVFSMKAAVRRSSSRAIVSSPQAEELDLFPSSQQVEDGDGDMMTTTTTTTMMMMMTKMMARCALGNKGSQYVLVRTTMSFDVTWATATAGIGDPAAGDFFIGLDKLHYLTQTLGFIHFFMRSATGSKHIINYFDFTVGPESSSYQLSYRWPAINGFAAEPPLIFSTPDHDRERLCCNERLLGLVSGPTVKEPLSSGIRKMARDSDTRKQRWQRAATRFFANGPDATFTLKRWRAALHARYYRQLQDAGYHTFSGLDKAHDVIDALRREMYTLKRDVAAAVIKVDQLDCGQPEAPHVDVLTVHVGVNDCKSGVITAPEWDQLFGLCRQDKRDAIHPSFKGMTRLASNIKRAGQPVNSSSYPTPTGTDSKIYLYKQFLLDESTN
nr:hypothetical protein BaRGS_010242 [Batillaria attramentaria]